MKITFRIYSGSYLKRELTVQNKMITVGSDPRSVIPILAEGVLPLHVMLQVGDDCTVHLLDYSDKGIRVNGRPVFHALVGDLDRIELCDNVWFELRVEEPEMVWDDKTAPNFCWSSSKEISMLHIEIFRSGSPIGQEDFSVNPVIIGSNSHSNLRLFDPLISPNHALLFVENGEIIYKTFEEQQTTRLSSGALLRIGHHTLKLTILEQSSELTEELERTH